MAKVASTLPEVPKFPCPRCGTLWASWPGDGKFWCLACREQFEPGDAVLVPGDLFRWLAAIAEVDAPAESDVMLARLARLCADRDDIWNHAAEDYVLQAFAAEARTSAAKYERDGWRRRAWKNAWLLTRYLMGAPPEALAKAYR